MPESTVEKIARLKKEAQELEQSQQSVVESLPVDEYRPRAEQLLQRAGDNTDLANKIKELMKRVDTYLAARTNLAKEKPRYAQREEEEIKIDVLFFENLLGLKGQAAKSKEHTTVPPQARQAADQETAPVPKVPSQPSAGHSAHRKNRKTETQGRVQPPKEAERKKVA